VTSLRTAGLRRNRGFLGGIALIAIAAFFLYHGWGLRAGNLVRMGPGYLPLTISFILLAMGAFKLGAALFHPPEAPAWPRLAPAIVVSLLPVAFGLLIRPLGIVLTTMFIVVCSRFALRERPRAVDLAIGLALGGFCALTFVVGLSQSMSIWPRIWQ
jgi:Tripartite tricarboxylate transporter TctB family